MYLKFGEFCNKHPIKTQNTAISAEISLVLLISQFSPTSTSRKQWFCSVFLLLFFFLSIVLKLSTTNCHLSVNYKVALTESICEQPNNHKGIFHLPALLQLLTFNTPWKEFSVESEALCAPGRQVEQVFR